MPACHCTTCLYRLPGAHQAEAHGAGDTAARDLGGGLGGQERVGCAAERVCVGGPGAGMCVRRGLLPPCRGGGAAWVVWGLEPAGACLEAGKRFVVRGSRARPTQAGGPPPDPALLSLLALPLLPQRRWPSTRSWMGRPSGGRASPFGEALLAAACQEPFRRRLQAAAAPAPLPSSPRLAPTPPRRTTPSRSRPHTHAHTRTHTHTRPTCASFFKPAPSHPPPTCPAA